MAYVSNKKIVKVKYQRNTNDVPKNTRSTVAYGSRSGTTAITPAQNGAESGTYTVFCLLARKQIAWRRRRWVLHTRPPSQGTCQKRGGGGRTQTSPSRRNTPKHRRKCRQRSGESQKSRRRGGGVCRGGSPPPLRKKRYVFYCSIWLEIPSIRNYAPQSTAMYRTIQRQ